MGPADRGGFDFAKVGGSGPSAPTEYRSQVSGQIRSLCTFDMLHARRVRIKRWLPSAKATRAFVASA